MRTSGIICKHSPIAKVAMQISFHYRFKHENLSRGFSQQPTPSEVDLIQLNVNLNDQLSIMYAYTPIAGSVIVV